MGLISAAAGSASGVLADQWKEAFVCDAMPVNVLAVKGRKKTSARSTNTKGSENIITTGSVVIVGESQCMIIVDQGKIVEVCAEPGEFIYDASTEPTVFCGRFGEGLLKSFQTFGRRFTFGGEPPKDQRVYYINTREILGNKYGTPSPIPFRIVDEKQDYDLDVGLKCFGEYTYRICDPIKFYKNVCTNVTGEFTRENIDSALKADLIHSLSPAFARIAEKGIRYYMLTGHKNEIRDALNEELAQDWIDGRGIEMVKFDIISLKLDEESEARLKEHQDAALYANDRHAMGMQRKAQAAAMQTAAANPGGSAMAFMGMNMANMMGNNAMDQTYQQQAMQQQMEIERLKQQMAMQQQAAAAPAAPAADSWQCSCGNTVTGKFCPECGSPKPVPKPADGWQCSCGSFATGKFCPECGSPRPEPKPDGWTCPTCGAVNKGKFCAECGTKKPAGIPQYRCDKCGWEPADPTKPPKFCPECGDPFDDGDIV